MNAITYCDFDEPIRLLDSLTYKDADWWKEEEISTTYAKTATVSEESDPSADLIERFENLSKSWKEQIAGASSVSRIVMHPSYLQIISLGPDAIGLILSELEKESGHWFIALKTLAGQKSLPLPEMRPEFAGNIKKLREMWLAWGKQHGYLN